MCRAVWVTVVGASDDAAKRIRRALGVEAQVVLVTTDASDESIRTTQTDAVVIDGDAPGARGLAAELASAGRAILWVGEDAPPDAHHASAQRDDLESALTRALLARKG